MTEPICSSDRWTCPTCHRTVVVDATDADTRCALAACQRRHAEGHRRATDVIARLGLPEPRHPGRNAGDVDRAGRRRPPRPRRGDT